MVSFVSAVRNTVLNLTFPRRCHSCTARADDDRLGVACSACWDNTTLFEESDELCPKCGAANSSTNTSFTCRGCTEHHYDSAIAVGVYEHAMSASILNLKKVPVIPRILFERIPCILDRAQLGNCDLIVPVPLSPKRRAERGFNQAECIADKVATLVNKPVDNQSLSRKIHSPMHRASMDRKARELSVKNAFEVTRPKLIEGRSILLVDDIFTSGATVSNCARALKKKGATSVRVLTLARTIMRRGA